MPIDPVALEIMKADHLFARGIALLAGEPSRSDRFTAELEDLFFAVLFQLAELPADKQAGPMLSLVMGLRRILDEFNESQPNSNGDA